MAAKKVFRNEDYQYAYSICTLVTSHDEYREMLSSFIRAGFTEDDCEFLYADNSAKNELDAYTGYNRFLREARGKYIIICHQDILLDIDNRTKLEEQISKVDRIDSHWGLLGNAGINNMYNMSMVFTDADMRETRKGILPSKVYSLDEHFILIKSSANLAVSGDLSGFHMYGTDICLVAECLGYSAYAINFNLIHKGVGTVDQSFHQLSEKLQKKYVHFFRRRYVRSTITRFYLSPSPFLNMIMDIGFIKSAVRFFYKIRFKIGGRL